MTADKTMDIHTVRECCEQTGQRPLHPGACVVDLRKDDFGRGEVRFGVYAVLLMEKCRRQCVCSCGHAYYDYSYATAVFLRPGERFSISRGEAMPVGGRLLTFDPCAVTNPSHKAHFEGYTFFSYQKDEALHLSKRETDTLNACLNDIDDELHRPLDPHTDSILPRLIEILLDHCQRFYTRQFITRENENRLLAGKVRAAIGWRIASSPDVPTEASIAAELGLSAAYLHDLLRHETGQTVADIHELHRIEAAKRMLLRGDTTPSAVARRLGYPSVQRFCCIFQRLTGIAPACYASSCN